MDVRDLPLAATRFSGDGDVIEVRSPFDGSLVGVVPACSAEDVDRAVRSARTALESPLPPWKRAEILDTAARLLRERREHFAQVISRETSKPISAGRVEADRAVSTFTFAAAEARTLAGEVIPLDAMAAGEGKIGFTLRVPIGVVGAIAPFNFPLNLVAHKVAPAIAAGCPVVLKPASQTPFSAIELADLLIGDCGLPPEYLHVVTGGGGSVGNAIVDHPDIALITFTGSPDVGWGIKARAPRKHVGLELGNNSPIIIEPDADWKGAAAKVKSAGYSNSGQSCISTQRLYVHASIIDEFTAELVRHVESIVVGDPADDATEVSALISESERDRVAAWIDEAVAGGATVATGGTIDDLGILRPTVLTDVTPSMKVCAGEVFGPVVTVAPYDDVNEAIRLANDSDYGLQAAIFTGSLATAMLAFRSLDYGGVLVNEVPTWRADQQPYGGVRDSGNTREGPAYAIREMTEIRMVVLTA